MDINSVVKNEFIKLDGRGRRKGQTLHFENEWIELWRSSWGSLLQALAMVILQVDAPNK